MNLKAEVDTRQRAAQSDTESQLFRDVDVHGAPGGGKCWVPSK